MMPPSETTPADLPSVEPPQSRYAPSWALKLWRTLARPPRGQDRSAELATESHGRLDRLDLWMVVVLIVGLLSMRAYNLGQPTSMYFDEVYHARSATEFLQDWNYHLPHNIFEWTHPPLAKYAIAAGITLFADDKVTGSANLGVPVHTAIVQERTAQSPGDKIVANTPIDYSLDFGDRVLVATGSEVRVYNLAARDLAYAYPISGVTTLSAPDAAGLVYAGTLDGKIFVLDTKMLDALRAGQVTTVPPPTQLVTSTGFAIAHLFAGEAPYLLAADDHGNVVSIDLGVDGGSIVGRGSVPGAADFASPGAGLLGTITNPQVLVAYQGGVGLLDVYGVTLGSTVATAAPATSLALNPDAISTNIYRYYVTAGNSLLLLRLDKSQSPVAISLESTQPLTVMPGPVSQVVFDEGTKLAQVLGQTPDGSGWTVYAVEGNGNAVFSDARLPFKPVTLGLDNAVTVSGIDTVTQMPGANREALLAFSPDGALASVDVGQFAFSWRIIGVLFGVLMAVCLYLLARLLFRRRSVGVLVALFCAVDGMTFVQSRIAMNDTYVAGFLLLAYLIFAVLWLRVWQHRALFWLGMPILGTVLGLALVSKWVALYAIASIGILILIRSALGRVAVVAGLIVGTGVLGWQALAEMSYTPNTGNIPLSAALIALACVVTVVATVAVIRTQLAPDKVFLGVVGILLASVLAAAALWVSPAPLNNGSPDYTFFLIMLAITAVAAALAAYRPIAWTRQEFRFTLFAPALFGLAIPWLLTFLALPIGFPLVLSATLKYSLLAGAAGLVLGIAAGLTFWLAGRLGFGPLASKPQHPDFLPPDPAPEGWLRLGSNFGLPAAWMAFCLALLPFLVYIALYIPVAMPWQAQTVQTGPLPALACWQVAPVSGVCEKAWPAGHTGQNLWDLTNAMYTYHNDLRDAHPAASPWWAWPLDLKPVWFAGGVDVPGASAAIYDAGNPVLWWLAIVGLAFVTWQAFRRRSLGLTLIVVAFFWQWLSWARIDREAFQYHFYTALPFFLLALAYFLAELWHGPSPRTWLLARVAGAIAALVPAFLWLSEPALCGLVRVNTSTYFGNAVCGTGLSHLSLPASILLIGVVLLAALLGLVLMSSHLERRLAGGHQDRYWLAVIFAPLVLGLILIGWLDLAGPSETLIWALPPVWPTLFWLSGGGLLAYLSLTATHPRRFVIGVGLLAGAAFLVLYPYLSATWLPGSLGNLYALLSPTWQYGFQFATDLQKGVTVKLLGSGSFSAIFLATSVAVVAAMLAVVRRASVRRQMIIEKANSDDSIVDPEQFTPE
jgi:predicted membrane-bound dolichyl-phosphate-mannose-protein mannosyltransferase